MKKYMLKAVLWGSVITTSGQEPFGKLYGDGVGGFRKDLIELSSGNVVTDISRGTGISLMDLNGNVIETNHFWADSILPLRSIQQRAMNEFNFISGRVSVCASSPSGLGTFPVIGVIDSIGHVQSMRSYELAGPGCFYATGSLEVTANKSVIACGYETSFFAMKVDSIGEPIWGKSFTNNGGFQFIRELPSGDLIAGINMDTAGAVVARLDALGNFLWCKSYIRPNGIINDVIIESDSSFIITGYTDSIDNDLPIPPEFNAKLFMMKLNGTGEVQWCRGYVSNHSWRTIHSSKIVWATDNNYVLLATIRTQLGMRPFLMKTDQNGDTLWTRSTGVTNYSYGTSSLMASSTGGYYFNGNIAGNLPGNYSSLPFLIKTASDGSMPCSAQWYPIGIEDLFPVDSSFTLTSSDGLEARPLSFQDTTLTPFSTYDACLITSVRPQYVNKYKPRIYPNPNTGRFTVDFVDPLRADSFYSVYDSMGKLLYQRPLPSGATTEEVDLARFGRGIYLLKITDPEGVRTERVVVE